MPSQVRMALTSQNHYCFLPTEDLEKEARAHQMRPFLSVWSKLKVQVAPVALLSRASMRGYTLFYTCMY